MSLSGLMRVITDDPELNRALDQAGSPGSPGGDLIAPPALRPFLVAALAGASAATRNGRSAGGAIRSPPGEAGEAASSSARLSSGSSVMTRKSPERLIGPKG